MIKFSSKNKKVITSSSLGSYLLFPDNYDWNEWLLYSLVNIFSNKVLAITDNKQFRYANVVIAAKVIFIAKSLNINSKEIM